MGKQFYQNQSIQTSRILYTPSEFAREELLYLQEIGQLEAQKPHVATHRNLASYLFMMVESGSGTLRYMDENYTLHSGDCALINCKNEYYHESSPALWHIRWIHFHGSHSAGIYQKYLDRGGEIVFHPSSLKKYKACWQKLYQQASSDNYIKDMKINEHLSALWSLIMEESWNPNESQTDGSKAALLTSIKDYLDNHYQEKISLNDLSEKFYINKFYLTRLFHERYGFTVHDYLLQVRITSAKQLLRFSSLPLEEVGQACGIEPLYYFSRVFKQAEGISPSVYRKQWG